MRRTVNAAGWVFVALSIASFRLVADASGQRGEPQAQTSAQHAREVGRLLIRSAMVIPGTGMPAYGPVDLLLERGTIARISPTIDPATHTAQLRCQVPNRSRALKPQMLVRVRIDTSTGETLVVPQEALVFETDGYYAFVEVGPNKITRRKVAIASWNEGGYARILDGLQGGERVIQGESIQASALWHRAHGESS